jgi:hypothetical protein
MFFSTGYVEYILGLRRVEGLNGLEAFQSALAFRYCAFEVAGWIMELLVR